MFPRKNKKTSLNYPCCPFLTGALVGNNEISSVKLLWNLIVEK